MQPRAAHPWHKRIGARDGVYSSGSKQTPGVGAGLMECPKQARPTPLPPQVPPLVSPPCFRLVGSGRSSPPGRLTPGVPGSPATTQAVAALPRAVDQAQRILAFLPDGAVLEGLVQKVHLPTQRGKRSREGETEPPGGPRLQSQAARRMTSQPGRCSSTQRPAPAGTARVLQGS